MTEKPKKKLIIYPDKSGEPPLFGCPECQAEVGVFDVFCRKCGTELYD